VTAKGRWVTYSTKGTNTENGGCSAATLIIDSPRG
jgi:hypothetical protein